jgi:hypothetical protein
MLELLAAYDKNLPFCAHRLAPIRGIPTKKGLQDPNQDLLEVFETLENIPSGLPPHRCLLIHQIVFHDKCHLTIEY